MFSPLFLQSLVCIAIAWTAIGAVLLLVLLYRDWKSGNLW